MYLVSEALTYTFSTKNICRDAIFEAKFRELSFFFKNQSFLGIPVIFKNKIFYFTIKKGVILLTTLQPTDFNGDMCR
jgi:hypothetical protein